MMLKRTYQPSKRKRIRSVGFRKWIITKSGRAIIQAKRKKFRAQLTIR